MEAKDFPCFLSVMFLVFHILTDHSVFFLMTSNDNHQCNTPANFFRKNIDMEKERKKERKKERGDTYFEYQ
jgi:hypothetical protein